jgi:hypothetical protein
MSKVRMGLIAFSLLVQSLKLTEKFGHPLRAKLL